MQRNRAIDIAKGITIILMILGHFNSLWNTVIFYMIFSFHMPLFFIFSGYFYKPKTNREFFTNGYNRLLKPYIITAIIAIAISFICYNKNAGVDYLLGALIGCMGSWNPLIKTYELQAGPIWFLLALFWCQIYYNIIQRKCSKYSTVICILLSLFFWKFSEKVINLPLCLGCAFTALIFYEARKLLRENGIDSSRYRWTLYLIWIAAFHFTYLNMAQYIYTWFPLSMTGAICGTIAIYDFSKKISTWMGISTLLIYIGQHTLEILCCHTIAWISRCYILKMLCIEETPLNMDISYAILTIIYTIPILIFKGFKPYFIIRK